MASAVDDFFVSRTADNARPEQQSQKTRACSNCARLKMKCQWPASGASRPESTCVRCTRMKLACQVPEPTQRKRRGKPTRVAQLEKKIDGLVSLLAANKGIALNGSSPLTPESPEAAAAQTLIYTGEDITLNDARPSDVTEDFAAFELLPGFRLTIEQADEYLNVYREQYQPKFPFVPISANVKAHQLHTEAKVLFWSIMSVIAPLPAAQQHETKRWFRKYLAEHIVVRQEKRLDILQAILVHLGWNDFHFYIEMQATNLLQLAMALVIDLKLDRPPGSLGITPRSLVSDAWSSVNKMANLRSRSAHSLEEKRAVLGYHHISCLIYSLFRRGCKLSWNAYLGRCCDSLADSREFESDLYLVSLVRMQHIADRVYSIMPSSTPEPQDPVQPVFRAPLDMAISGVRREMESFAKMQPEVIRQNPTFWAHYHILLMRLYEPVISMKAPSLADTDALAAEPFQRAEALWKCLQCASSFFDTQLATPPAAIHTLPFTCSGLLAFAVVTTSRLVLLEASTDWEPALARKKLDFADLARRMSEQFEEAERCAREAGRRRRVLDDGSSVFMKYGFKLRWIRQWYLARTPPEQGVPLDDAAAVTNTGVPSFRPVTPDLGLNQWAGYQIDENFWQELLTVYDSDTLGMPGGMAMPDQQQQPPPPPPPV